MYQDLLITIWSISLGLQILELDPLSNHGHFKNHHANVPEYVTSVLIDFVFINSLSNADHKQFNISYLTGHAINTLLFKPYIEY